MPEYIEREKSKKNPCPFCEKVNLLNAFNKRELAKPFKSILKAVLKEEVYKGNEKRADMNYGKFALNYCPTCGAKMDKKEGAARMADIVLSDGWIRPPCKVGDKLFRVVKLLNGERFVVEGIALEYTETFENGKINKRIYFWANGEEFTRRQYSLWLEISKFGKTVFLTREEAEKTRVEMVESV